MIHQKLSKNKFYRFYKNHQLKNWWFFNFEAISSKKTSNQAKT